MHSQIPREVHSCVNSFPSTPFLFSLSSSVQFQVPCNFIFEFRIIFFPNLTFPPFFGLFPPVDIAPALLEIWARFPPQSLSISSFFCHPEYWKPACHCSLHPTQSQTFKKLILFTLSCHITSSLSWGKHKYLQINIMQTAHHLFLFHIIYFLFSLFPLLPSKDKY